MRKKILTTILLAVISMKVHSIGFNSSLEGLDLMYLDEYVFYMPPFGGIGFYGVYNCTRMYDYWPSHGYTKYVTNWEFLDVVTQAKSSVSSIYANNLYWYVNIEGPVFGMGIADDYTLTYVVGARLTAESTMVINGSKISVTQDIVLNGVSPCWC